MLKRLLQVSALLLVAALLVPLALPRVVSHERGRDLLLALASSLSGYTIEASTIEITSPWRFSLENLRIGLRSGQPLLSARELEVSVPLQSLVEGRAGVVGIDGFEIWVAGAGSGVSADRSSVLQRLPFEELRASDGVITLAGYDDLSIAIVEVTARPSLAGQGVVSRLSLSAEGGPLGRRIELVGSLVVGHDSDRAELDCTLRLAAAVPPARLRGTVYGMASSESPRLDLSLAWPGVALASLSQAFLADSGLEVASGRLSLNARVGGPLASPRVTATLELEKVEASGRSLRFSGSAKLPVRYDDAGLSIDALTLSNLALAHSGFDVAVATVAATAKLELGGESVGLSLGGITVDGVDAHNHDYSRVLQGLSLAGHASMASTDAGASVSLSLASEGGEMLWDSFYVDLAETSAAVALDAVSGRDSITVDELTLTLDDIGHFLGQAELAPGGKPRRLSLSFDITGLERAYQLFVAGPLQAGHPTLAGLGLSGRVFGDLEASQLESTAPLLDGHVSLRVQQVVAGGGRLRIDGLEAELPVMLGGSPQAHSGESAPGRISLGGGDVGGLEIPAFKVALRVDRDRMEATDPLALEVAGGTVWLDYLELYDLSDSRRRLVLGLRAEGLEGAELLAAARLPALAGTVAAEFPRIEVSSSAVESRGEVKAEFFGGQLIAHDLRLEQLDTPVPAMLLGVEASDIDLARVTAATRLGEISGIASGAIANLEIVAGEPVGFEAWVETVPVRGVRQRISVTALEQLQILGGGGNNPLTRGLLSFFDAYRYARMGIRCRLRNDNFVLQGVETRDGKDYLVVGSLLPPTVNVISHNQSIDFSQMVERLARMAEVGSGSASVDEGSR